MPAPPRNPGDQEAWQQATEGVKPLHAFVKTESPEANPSVFVAPLTSPEPAPPQPTPHGTARPPQPLDPQILRRIARRRLPVEGRLDLHGLTQEQAHAALEQFVQFAVGQSWRTILVITGRGRGGEGLLRQALPGWLEEATLRELVSGYGQAHRADGGDGAFYLRLRKRK